MTAPDTHIVLRLALTRWKRRTAFTLIELLVATAVLSMLVLLLSSMLSSALDVWRRGRSQSEVRESARSVIELITNELRQVVLPPDPTASNNLEFVISSPDLNARFKHRDTIFWQAPVANNQGKGDLAIVGYFIRQDGARSSLCRVFINPGEAYYTIYDDSVDWLSDEMLDAVAPADDASFLKGLVLENVPGLWVTAYQDDMTPYPSYNSRTAGRLPRRVDISLVLLDPRGAQMQQAGVLSLPAASSYANADAYIAAVPQRGRDHVKAISFSVPLAP